MSEKSLDQAQPVSFGERLAGSQAFAELFRDGMALVEETATYLDGPGRQQSKKLERGAALAYATESMRLTTRLMQLASWLLLHRAVKEGEMSLAQAGKEKSKVKLAASDGQITTDVKSQLAGDSLSKGVNIGVTTTRGVVALTGTLTSQNAIDHVKDVAGKVKDVKSVDTSALVLASL